MPKAKRKSYEQYIRLILNKESHFNVLSNSISDTHSTPPRKALQVPKTPAIRRIWEILGDFGEFRRFLGYFGLFWVISGYFGLFGVTPWGLAAVDWRVCSVIGFWVILGDFG